MILATINNIDFVILLRSNIKHNKALLTNKVNKCGLDFYKSVVITDKEEYVDENKKPILRQHEFDELKVKYHIVKKKMESYIKNHVQDKI